jgi:hypothetical protein
VLELVEAGARGANHRAEERPASHVTFGIKRRLDWWRAMPSTKDATLTGTASTHGHGFEHHYSASRIILKSWRSSTESRRAGGKQLKPLSLPYGLSGQMESNYWTGAEGHTIPGCGICEHSMCNSCCFACFWTRCQYPGIAVSTVRCLSPSGL